MAGCMRFWNILESQFTPLQRVKQSRCWPFALLPPVQLVLVLLLAFLPRLSPSWVDLLFALRPRDPSFRNTLLTSLSMPSLFRLLSLFPTVSLVSVLLLVREGNPNCFEVIRFTASIVHPSYHLCAFIVGFWGAGAASLICPTAVPALFAILKAYPFVLAIAKGLVAFPLSFHWFAGIRHLVRIYPISPFTGA